MKCYFIDSYWKKLKVVLKQLMAQPVFIITNAYIINHLLKAFFQHFCSNF